jgi:3-oxoacyl-[acyl-carrier protein] reductase
LKETKADAVVMGVQVEAVPTDVCSEEQIEALFSITIKRFNRLDILVNNAGAFDGGPSMKFLLRHGTR